MAKKRQAPGERASLLDKPRVLYAEPGYLSQGLFYGVLLLLGSVGSLGCFFGAFQVPVSPWPAVAVGSVCLLFFLVLFLWKRPSWVLSLVGIVLWGAAVWYFFPDLIQGCAHTVNLVLEAYGNKLGTALPQLATDTATLREIQRQCTVFCCLFPLPLPVLPGMGAGGAQKRLWGLLRHRFFGLCAHAHLPGAPCALPGSAAGVLGCDAAVFPPPLASATGCWKTTAGSTPQAVGWPGLPCWPCCWWGRHWP